MKQLTFFPMRHIRIFLLANLLIGVLNLPAQQVAIIPLPQQVELNAGNFSFQQKPSILYPENLSLKSAELIETWAASKYPDAKAGENAPQIILGLPEQDSSLASLCQEKGIRVDTLGEEAYHLLIESDLILLVAKEEPGLLYAVQSLLQLLEANHDTEAITCMKIYDAPAFAHRAIMDDISRGPISHMNFIKEQIRRLSSLKINTLSFYIEHVVKTKSHPAFAPPDAISIAEFAELSAYAKPYHVKLLGSFQSLGHYRNILSTPDYSYLSETDRMLKPADPESYAFLTEVYSEMIPAFSSEYFNINADEAYDLSQGRLKPLEDSLGTGRLFTNHVVPLLDFIEKKNKKPMLWGDMLLAHPEAIQDLPASSTVLTWEYGDPDSFAPWIDPFQEAGIDFWVCPGIVNSYKFMPDYEVSFNNIRNFIAEGYEKGAKGVMTTIWDDGGGHLFAKDWYGVTYAADQSWHPSEDQAAFEARYSQAFYGDTTNAFPALIKELTALKDFRSTQDLNTASFDQQIVPERGVELIYYLRDVSDVLQKCEYASWELNHLKNQSKKSDTRFGKEELLYWEFLLKHLWENYEALASFGFLQDFYEHAKKLQSENNPLFREELARVQSTTEKFRKPWISLKERYKSLWFKENRAYSLEEATKVFDKKIQRFHSLIRTLDEIDPDAPLPEAKEVGLGINGTLNQYFSFWLISPVFDLKNGEAWTDYLQNLGGEEEAKPTPYDWQKYQSPFTDKVQLNQVRDFENPSIIYAYSRIESPKADTVQAELTFFGTFEIILNGAKLGKRVPKKSGKRLEIIRQNLSLQAGQNHLIIKMLVDPRDDAFSFHLLNTQIRNGKHKYKLIKLE